jgi:hypothetical protein
MFFVPIGYNFQFDYINKGIIMNKEYIISCMNNCFKKKNISFNEIKYFKLQTFNFVFIAHYNLGYYDINQKFEILFLKNIDENSNMKGIIFSRYSLNNCLEYNNYFKFI